MKKRKIKLFASVASLAMVAAVMGVGVWAATQQAVNVSSTVAFQSSSILGKVELAVTGDAVDTIKAGPTENPTAALTKGTKTELINITSLTQANQAAAGTYYVDIMLADSDGNGYFSAADVGNGVTGDGVITYTFTITGGAGDDLFYQVVVPAEASNGWTASITPGTASNYDPEAETQDGLAGTSETTDVTVTFTYSGAAIGNLEQKAAIPQVTVKIGNETEAAKWFA